MCRLCGNHRIWPLEKGCTALNNKYILVFEKDNVWKWIHDRYKLACNRFEEDSLVRARVVLFLCSICGKRLWKAIIYDSRCD